MMRRDRFLGEINAVMPWSSLVTTIRPPYLKGEGLGRSTVGVGCMRHMYIARQCFGLLGEDIDDVIVRLEEGSLQVIGQEHRSTFLRCSSWQICRSPSSGCLRIILKARPKMGETMKFLRMQDKFC